MPSVTRIKSQIKKKFGLKGKAKPKKATSRTKTAATTKGANPSLTALTKEQLYKKAKKIGIEGRSNMNKSQLVRALRSH